MEAMRQEIDSLHASLANRHRELEAAEEVRQMLEDALEDANTKIDDLHRKLEKLGVDADEAEYRREEAEQARRQVQEALYRFKQEVEQAKAADMRDERLASAMRRPLDIDKVTSNTGTVVWGVLIGLVVGFIGLEALSIIQGKGELVSLLLN